MKFQKKTSNLQDNEVYCIVININTFLLKYQNIKTNFLNQTEIN